MKDWIKLIRVKHWIKNAIVFFPLFFGKGFDQITIERSIFAFVSFSILASSIYVFNDILDVEKDRRHPVKCNRPIAAGRITIKSAVIGHCLLVLCGILLFGFVGNSVYFIPALLLYVGYYVLNIIYTVVGKNIPLLDIVILASGFIIRLFFGSMTTGIVISEWLYLVILSGAFYLGLSKRRNELKKQENAEIEKESRAVLKYYNYEFLDKNMQMCLTLAIVFYSLWCMSYGEKSAYLLSTIPIILIIVMKYSLNIEKDGANGDPTDTILGDKVLLMLVALLGAMMCFILYVI